MTRLTSSWNKTVVCRLCLQLTNKFEANELWPTVTSYFSVCPFVPPSVCPLPRLPFYSDSIVGAEIAGRSMPDEHHPVGPFPPSPQYPIACACCLTDFCPLRMHVCFACDVCFTCDSDCDCPICVWCVSRVRQNVRWVCFNNITVKLISPGIICIDSLILQTCMWVLNCTYQICRL